MLSSYLGAFSSSLAQQPPLYAMLFSVQLRPQNSHLYSTSQYISSTPSMWRSIEYIKSLASAIIVSAVAGCLACCGTTTTLVRPIIAAMLSPKVEKRAGWPGLSTGFRVHGAPGWLTPNG